MKFVFISAKEDDFPVDWMCRRLEVSTSGFYRWQAREEPARTRSDRRLGTIVRAIHSASRETYGSPRFHRELMEQGERVGRKRVARVTRKNGLTGTRPRGFRATTDSVHQLPVAPNVAARDFSPPARNHTWAANITHVHTWNGWIYLAVVIDLHSRRVVGWAAAEHMRTGLVIAARNMAVTARKPPVGLVIHSDRGSQYASREHRNALERYGIRCSMSRKGDCWDNAVDESFFGTLKQELI